MCFAVSWLSLVKGFQGSCVAMGVCRHANLFVGAAHRGPWRRLAPAAQHHAAQCGLQRQPSPPRSSGTAGAGRRRQGRSSSHCGLSTAHGAFFGESGATLLAICLFYLIFLKWDLLGWDGWLASWLVDWLEDWSITAKPPRHAVNSKLGNKCARRCVCLRHRWWSGAFWGRVSIILRCRW